MEKVLSEYEDLLQAYKKLQAKYTDLEAENRRLLEAEAERMDNPLEDENIALRAQVECYRSKIREVTTRLQGVLR